jgi:hypothetical protein
MGFYRRDNLVSAAAKRQGPAVGAGRVVTFAAMAAGGQPTLAMMAAA